MDREADMPFIDGAGLIADDVPPLLANGVGMSMFIGLVPVSVWGRRLGSRDPGRGPGSLRPE
jgi:hypothetical protein